MNSLTKISIGDVQYRNPIFVASTPATDSASKVFQGIKAGAGAIFLKTTLPSTGGKNRKGFSFAMLSPDRKTWFNTGSTAHEMNNSSEILFDLLKDVYNHFDQSELPVVPSVATKETLNTQEIDFASLLPLVKPVVHFSAMNDIPINIELNFRYMIRILERNLCPPEFKNIADEYFSIAHEGITNIIIQNIHNASVFFDKINNNYNSKIGLILKFPFRTDIGNICLQTCPGNLIIKAISVVNTIKSPGKLQWGTHGKSKLFQVSGSALTEMARYSIFQLHNLLNIPIISTGGVAMELQDSLHDFSTAAEASWLLKEFRTLREIAKQDVDHNYTKYIESKTGAKFSYMAKLVSWLNHIENEASNSLSFTEKIQSLKKDIQAKKMSPDDVQIESLTKVIAEYTDRENRKAIYFRSILALEDILDRIYIGSTAVQVGTAMLSYPGFSGLKGICDLMQAFFESEVFRELVFQDNVGNLDRGANNAITKRIKEYVHLKNYIGLYAEERHSTNIELHKPRYRVDHTLCTRCGKCLDIPYCTGAISNTNGEITINENLCGSCGVCFQSCLYGAIVKDSTESH